MHSIQFDNLMAIKLADYLLEHMSKKGWGYTIEMFSAEVGIPAGTLSAMMQPGKEAHMVKIDYLQAFIRYFKKDFTDTFGLTPPEE